MDIDLAGWCEKHLGARPVAELWRTGHLSTVVALRLDGARHTEVVVKIRPWEPVLPGCHAVHRHLWSSGFPCPEPLTGPTRVGERGELAVSAEAHLPGGAPGRPDDPTLAARSARYLHQLISDAPAPDEVPSLAPPRPWVGWADPRAAPWPPPDEGPDLNDHPATADLRPLAAELNARLNDGGAGAAAASLPAVVGHADWYQGNLRWEGDRLLAADDWDSISALPEATLAGCAAVSVRPATSDAHPFGWPGTEIADTEAFLDHYQVAAGRTFTRDEQELAWAAGLWQRVFDAAKFLVAGRTDVARGQIRDADERRRRASCR